MNRDDINFAHQVRHALNANLESLPASTTERLAAARALALSRKKPDAPVRMRVGLGRLGSLFALDGMAYARVALPLLLVAAGAAGVYQYQEQQRIAELAELDAAVLSDELPLTAYLDHGFNAYLESQQPAQ
ncbi:MAG TPA: DUF3619 family protein [Telluria sp.]